MRDIYSKISSFLISGGAVLLVGMSAGMGPVQAAQQAGVAAGVVGNLRVSEGARPAPSEVTSGMDMLLRDRVNSAAESRMQILLLDETVFTIGPDSDLVIDEFVYDPNAQTGHLTANFTKGVLRYISGKIAHSNPNAVTIKSRDATIGVRGTALFIMDDPESTDGAQFIGLLGPGSSSDDGLDPGRIVISSGGKSITVMRAGYGVFVTPGQVLTKPVPTPGRLLQAMQGQLTGLMPNMKIQKAQKQAVARAKIKQKQQIVQNKIKQKRATARSKLGATRFSANRHGNAALIAAIGGHRGEYNISQKLLRPRISGDDRRSSLENEKQISKAGRRASLQRFKELRARRAIQGTR